MVMEFLKGGELLQRIRERQHFTESQAARIWHKLVIGVSHIHSKGIVHRDLKPEVGVFCFLLFVLFSDLNTYYAFFRIYYSRAMMTTLN